MSFPVEFAPLEAAAIRASEGNVLSRETSFLVKAEDRRYIYLTSAFPSRDLMDLYLANEPSVLAAFQDSPAFRLAKSDNGKTGYVVVAHVAEMPTESQSMDAVTLVAKILSWKWGRGAIEEEELERIIELLPATIKTWRIPSTKVLSAFLRTYETRLRHQMELSRQDPNPVDRLNQQKLVRDFIQILDDVNFSDPTSFLNPDSDRRFFFFNAVFTALHQRFPHYGPRKEELQKQIKAHPDFLFATSSNGKMGLLPRSYTTLMPTESVCQTRVAQEIVNLGWTSPPPVHDVEKLDQLFARLPGRLRTRRIRDVRSLIVFLFCYRQKIDAGISDARDKASSIASDESSTMSPLDKAITNLLKKAKPTTKNAKIKSFSAAPGQGKLYFKISWLMDHLPTPQNSPFLKSRTTFTDYLCKSPLYHVNQNCVHLSSFAKNMSTEQQVEKELKSLLTAEESRMSVMDVIARLSESSRMRIRSKVDLAHFVLVTKNCCFYLESDSIVKKGYGQQQHQLGPQPDEKPPNPQPPELRQRRQNYQHEQEAARENLSNSGYLLVLKDNKEFAVAEFKKDKSRVIVDPHSFFIDGVKASSVQFDSLLQVGNEIKCRRMAAKKPVKGCEYIAVQSWIGKAPQHLDNPMETLTRIYNRLTDTLAEENFQAPLVAKVIQIQGDFAIVDIKNKGKALMYRQFFTHDKYAGMTKPSFVNFIKKTAYNVFVLVVKCEYQDFKFVVRHGWSGKRLAFPKVDPDSALSVTLTRWLEYQQTENQPEFPETLNGDLAETVSTVTTVSSEEAFKEPAQTPALHGHVVYFCKERKFAVVRSKECYKVLVHHSRLFLNKVKIEKAEGGFVNNIQIGTEIGYVAVGIDSPLHDCLYVAGRAWIGEKPEIGSQQRVDNVVKILRPGQTQCETDASQAEVGYVTQLTHGGFAMVVDRKGRNVFLHKSKIVYNDCQMSEEDFRAVVNVGTKVRFVASKFRDDETGEENLTAEKAWIGGNWGELTAAPDPLSLKVDGPSSNESRSDTPTSSSAIGAGQNEESEPTPTKTFSPDDILEGVVRDVFEDFVVMSAVRNDVDLGGTAILHRDRLTNGGTTGFTKSSFAFLMKKGISIEFQAAKVNERLDGFKFVAWSGWIAGSDDWPGGNFSDEHMRWVSYDIDKWLSFQQSFVPVTETSMGSNELPKLVSPAELSRAVHLEDVRGDCAVLNVPKKGQALMHRLLFTVDERHSLNQQDYAMTLKAKTQHQLFARLVPVQKGNFSYVVAHGWMGKRKVMPPVDDMSGKAIAKMTYKAYELCFKNNTSRQSSVMSSDNEDGCMDRIMMEQIKRGRKVYTHIQRKESSFVVLSTHSNGEMLLIELDKAFVTASGKGRAKVIFPFCAFTTTDSSRVTASSLKAAIDGGVDFKMTLVESLLPDVDFVVLSAGVLETRKLPLCPEPGETDIVLYAEKKWLNMSMPLPSSRKVKEESNVVAESKPKHKDAFHHGRAIQLLNSDFALLHVKGKGRVLVCRDVVTDAGRAVVGGAAFSRIFAIGRSVTAYVRTLTPERLGVRFVASHAFTGPKKALPMPHCVVEHVLEMWEKTYGSVVEATASTTFKDFVLLESSFSPYFDGQAEMRKVLLKVLGHKSEDGKSDLTTFDLLWAKKRPHLFKINQELASAMLAYNHPSFKSEILRLLLPRSPIIFFEDKSFLRSFLYAKIGDITLTSAGHLDIKCIRGYCVGRAEVSGAIEIAFFAGRKAEISAMNDQIESVNPGQEDDVDVFKLLVARESIVNENKREMDFLTPVAVDLTVAPQEEDCVPTVLTCNAIALAKTEADVKLAQLIWLNHPAEVTKVNKSLLSENPAIDAMARPSSFLDLEMQMQMDEEFDDDVEAFVLPGDEEILSQVNEYRAGHKEAPNTLVTEYTTSALLDVSAPDPVVKADPVKSSKGDQGLDGIDKKLMAARMTGAVPRWTLENWNCVEPTLSTPLTIVGATNIGAGTSGENTEGMNIAEGDRKARSDALESSSSCLDDLAAGDVTQEFLATLERLKAIDDSVGGAGGDSGDRDAGTDEEDKKSCVIM